jgi:hypothetical protein
MGLLAASACSRSLPETWPAQTPLSVEAPPAAAANVTLALDADPPLPGEAREGWTGLEAAAPSGGHQHHHAPAKPPTKPSEETDHAGH